MLLILQASSIYTLSYLSFPHYIMTNQFPTTHTHTAQSQSQSQITSMPVPIFGGTEHTHTCDCCVHITFLGVYLKTKL